MLFGCFSVVNKTFNMKYTCEVTTCGFTTNRSDNFDRHKLSHSKEKIQCECGKLLAPSSVWRHKSKACFLRAKEAPVAQKPIDLIAPAFPNESVVKVETNVHVEEADGQISFRHDPIVINGIQFVLVPASSIMTSNPPPLQHTNLLHDANLNRESE